MNKIKVLYDVVKTMKKKESINGEVNLKVTKEGADIISLTNEFHRNNVSGDVKAKISKKINIDGKKINQESDIELNSKDCPFHKFSHHMHNHKDEHFGFKGKLSRAAFMLNILNNLEAESRDKKTVLSLNLKEVIREGKEIRAEFKKDLNEMGKDENVRRHHNPPEFIKQLFSGDYKEAVLYITINESNEVEKLELKADGENIINGSVKLNY